MVDNDKKFLIDTGMPLLWVLRDILGLTGTKYGCGIEVCGACTVLVDGQAGKSCDFDVGSAVGKKIVTIDGLSPAGTQSQSGATSLDCEPGSAVRLLPARHDNGLRGRRQCGASWLCDSF